jgi:hypothetical protein
MKRPIKLLLKGKYFPPYRIRKVKSTGNDANISTEKNDMNILNSSV